MHEYEFVCMYTSLCSIHPGLKSVVYSAGIAFGDVEQCDYLWSVYQTTNETSEENFVYQHWPMPGYSQGALYTYA